MLATLLLNLAGLPSGDHVLSIRATNDTIIHVPELLNTSKPTPIVLALHGLGDNYPDLFQKQIQMDSVAQYENFVVVYPLGSPSISVALAGHMWNGGKCCFSKADDTTFLRSVVNRTSALINVDRRRVYAFGFSAGGVMSHTLGCTAADVFAAVASVDGPIEVSEPCAPVRPMPVLHFHGTLDPVFPYHGTAIYNGADQTLAAWKTVDNCTGAAVNTTLSPRVHIAAYAGVASEVQLATVNAGGHNMPPENAHPEEYIWNFFSRWQLPA